MVAIIIFTVYVMYLKNYYLPETTVVKVFNRKLYNRIYKYISTIGSKKYISEYQSINYIEALIITTK